MTVEFEQNKEIEQEQADKDAALDKIDAILNSSEEAVVAEDEETKNVIDEKTENVENDKDSDGEAVPEREEAVEAGEGQGDATEEEEEEEEEVIPDRLVSAGRRTGMTDEEIQIMATHDLNSLETLASALEKTDVAAAQVNQEQETKAEPQPDNDPDDILAPVAVDLDPKDYDEKYLTTVKQLAERNNKLAEAVKELRVQAQSSQAAQVKDQIRRIDEHFDSRVNDYPQLGKSEDRSQQAKERRIKVLRMADSIQQGSSEPMEYQTAMDAALNVIYGNVNKSDKSDKSEALMRKIRRNSKRLTMRPTHRRPSAPVKPAMSDRDRGIEKIGKILGS